MEVALVLFKIFWNNPVYCLLPVSFVALFVAIVVLVARLDERR